MTTGAIPLSRYPASRVLLACRTCPRKGQYSKAALIERCSPNESLVVLRLRVAAGWGCPVAKSTLAGAQLPGADLCGAYYPQLR
jgi:hypothetical protein